MSVSMPSHLLDTLESAATTTHDAVGELVHDAVTAVRRHRRPSRRWMPAAVIGIIVAVAVAMVARRLSRTRAEKVPASRSGSSAEPSTSAAEHGIDGVDSVKDNLAKF